MTGPTTPTEPESTSGGSQDASACGSCARLLDALQSADARADRAEVALARVHDECDDMEQDVNGHDEDADGMRAAVARIRAALGEQP